MNLLTGLIKKAPYAFFSWSSTKTEGGGGGGAAGCCCCLLLLLRLAACAVARNLPLLWGAGGRRRLTVVRLSALVLVPCLRVLSLSLSLPRLSSVGVRCDEEGVTDYGGGAVCCDC